MNQAALKREFDTSLEAERRAHLPKNEASDQQLRHQQPTIFRQSGQVERIGGRTGESRASGGRGA